jgi:hypothetical protein
MMSSMERTVLAKERMFEMRRVLKVQYVKVSVKRGIDGSELGMNGWEWTCMVRRRVSDFEAIGPKMKF